MESCRNTGIKGEQIMKEKNQFDEKKQNGIHAEELQETERFYNNFAQGVYEQDEKKKKTDKTKLDKLNGKLQEEMPSEARDSARELYGSERTFSDSEEMTAVKNASKRIERLLFTKGEGDMRSLLSMLNMEYDSAIRVCEAYLKSHNPWTTAGKERKTLVRDNMERFIREKELIATLREQADRGKADIDRADTPLELLETRSNVMEASEWGRAELKGNLNAFMSLKRMKDKPDSHEMKEVKDAYKRLFDYLADTKLATGLNDFEGQKNQIQIYINELSQSCAYYLDKFRENKDDYGEGVRLEKVSKLFDSLIILNGNLFRTFEAVHAAGVRDVSLSYIYHMTMHPEKWINEEAEIRRKQEAEELKKVEYKKAKTARDEAEKEYLKAKEEGDKAEEEYLELLEEEKRLKEELAAAEQELSEKEKKLHQALERKAEEEKKRREEEEEEASRKAIEEMQKEDARKAEEEKKRREEEEEASLKLIEKIKQEEHMRAERERMEVFRYNAKAKLEVAEKEYQEAMDENARLMAELAEAERKLLEDEAALGKAKLKKILERDTKLREAIRENAEKQIEANKGNEAVEDENEIALRKAKVEEIMEKNRKRREEILKKYVKPIEADKNKGQEEKIDNAQKEIEEEKKVDLSRNAQDIYDGMSFDEILDKELADTSAALEKDPRVLKKREKWAELPYVDIDATDEKMKGTEKVGEDQNFPMLFPYGVPTMRDVTQSGLNDCYLISTLAGIVMRNPDYITNTLIKRDYKDPGIVTVRLFDGDGELQNIRVNTTRFTDNSRARWVQAVEKAAAVLITSNGKSASLKKGVDWSKEVLGDGSVDVNVLKYATEIMACRLFFGSTGIDIKTRDEGIYDNETGLANTTTHKMGYAAVGKMLAYLNAKKIVVASTCTRGTEDRYNIMNDSVKFPERIETDIRQEHVYLVMGKGQKVIDGENTILVRDPYDGRIVELKISEFITCFSDLYVSGIEDMDVTKLYERSKGDFNYDEFRIWND